MIGIEQVIEQMVEEAEKLESGGINGSQEGSVSGESGQFCMKYNQLCFDRLNLVRTCTFKKSLISRKPMEQSVTYKWLHVTSFDVEVH